MMAEQSAVRTVGFILLGNVGVGKSFLANVVLGEQKFRSAAAVKCVTNKTECKEIQTRNMRFLIFDIPGLIEANQAAIDRNKSEIYKAFEMEPNCVIGFVFNTFGGGRLRNEDVVAFNALRDAYEFQGESLVVILNGVPADCEPDYNGEMICMMQELVKVPEGTQYCFLPQINKTDPGERSTLQTEILRVLFSRAANVHVKQHEIKLEAEEIEELKEKIKQKTEEFEKKLDNLSGDIEKRQKEFDEYKIESEKKLQDAEANGMYQLHFHVTLD
jgi:GTPase SAR1 family protein